MIDQPETAQPDTDQPGFAPVRPVDRAKFAALAPDERYSQVLLGHDNGARHCSIAYIQTPPGGGSPEGLHTHEGDQIFFVLQGTMSIEVDGTEHSVEAGNLIVFPAGVPHRNWNGGTEPTVHLAVNAPLPDPAKPFARRVNPASG